MRLLLGALVALVTCAHAWSVAEYAKKDDGAFEWRDTFQNAVGDCPRKPGVQWRASVLHVTSQRWLDETYVNKVIWQHQLAVVEPVQEDEPVSSRTWLMWATGGKHPALDKDFDFDDFEFKRLIDIACASLTPVAGVYQVPYQPLQWKGEDRNRGEDNLIAATWRSFIEASPTERREMPHQLLQFPMAKTVIRAMDAVQQWARRMDMVPPEDFILSGASKRGWTTWLAAAVEGSVAHGGRVRAHLPVVLDLLDVDAQLQRHFQSYNGWSFVLKPYKEEAITGYLGTPEATEMLSHIDPVHRLRATHGNGDGNNYDDMTTLIISSTADEFLLPDDVSHFWPMRPRALNQLSKSSPFFGVSMQPNCNHAAIPCMPDLLKQLTQVTRMITRGQALPKIEWSVSEQGEIKATVAESTALPTKVLLWSASTIPGAKRRDFRIATGTPPYANPIVWSSTSIEPVPGTQGRVYHALRKAPVRAWRAFFLQFRFDTGVEDEPDFKVSTGVSIVPLGLPYEMCEGEECNNAPYV
ncbi:MAG: hypothetical protein MHM6MM_003390 [Cercozoa sp. M6MM]